MPEGLGFSLFVLAAVVFLGGFAVGTQWNVRKGDGALKWFRQGLPLIGEKTAMRWLGSSVLELKIQKAKDPFRNAETLVVFEPRDVLLLWAFFHARGRRDLLIFRAQLSSAPMFEMEAFDPRAWTTHNIGRDVQQKNWKQIELPSTQSLLAYYSGDHGASAAKPLIALAAGAGAKLVRLSLHRTVPNLEVHWQLPDVKSHPARDLFLKLRQLGEQTLRA
jgi:hypothetical protein